MSKALSTVFFITTMFIVFIGQSMAFSNYFFSEIATKSSIQKYSHSLDKSSKMRSLAQNNSQKNQDKTHKESNRTTSDCIDIECCATDCCDVECVCATGNCSSLMYLNNELSTDQLATFHELSALLLPRQTKSFISGPYRPPIYNV
jgi:hypothetical protein